jgi:CRP-like cAMP-binding protein
MMASSRENDGDRAGPMAGHVLIRRLRHFDLSERELALIPGPDAPLQVHEPGMSLVREGQDFGTPHLLVSGWACCHRLLSDGRRQILCLLLPGDCIGLAPDGLPARAMPWTVTSLTRIHTTGLGAVIAAVRAEREACAGLVRGLAAIAAEEQHRLIERIMSLGRRSATERLAQLLLELHQRLAAVGLADQTHFPCPLTQEVIADLLGLSTVHVNRTLQQLRRDGLLSMRSGQVQLLDAVVLGAIAEYEPATAPHLAALGA